MLNFLKIHKKLLTILLFVMAGVFVFGMMGVDAEGGVMRTIGESFLSGVSYLVYGYVWVIGQFLIQMIKILVGIAGYNNFVTSSAVEHGWVIVRDIVNMFFILILLVIAFATIFNVKDYKYQTMLPRLLIMAVVINFSRTICGIFIDFGQVVMLTFVNGFQAAAGGNFVNALKIDALMKWSDAELKEGASPNLFMVFAAFLLAAIMVTVAFVVITAMVVMLAFRIVILWFLIILSPLAFLASVWPSGRIKEKYSKWWDMFLDNIVAGPLLAFFLWLSLLVLGSGTAGIDEKITPSSTGEGEFKSNVGYSQIGTEDNMISYIMGIMMLLGSLYMAQSMRSAGGDIAGKGLGMLQKYGKVAVMKTGMGTAKRFGRTARRAVGLPAMKAVARIPLVGGLALKGTAALQKQEQERMKVKTGYVASLTPEQKQRRLRQLRRTRTFRPLSGDIRNELAALEKENIVSISKDQWKPDESGKMKGLTRVEWHNKQAAEFQKGTDFLKTQEVYDPDIKEKIKTAEDVRPDLLKKDKKIKKAQSLSASDAGKLKPMVFEDDEFVGGLGADARNKLKKDASDAIKKNIAKWEEKQFGPSERNKRFPAAAISKGAMTTEDFEDRLDPKSKRPDRFTDDDVSKIEKTEQTPGILKAIAGKGRIDALIKADNLNVDAVLGDAELSKSIAPKIASSDNTRLKEALRQKKDPSYTEGLRQSIKKPGEHSAERVELLNMDENVSNIYKIDAGGNFANDAEENNFTKDITENKSVIKKIGRQLKGEMAQVAYRSLDVQNFIRMKMRAKTPEDKEDLKNLIKNYQAASKESVASDDMRKIAKQIESLKE